MNTDASDLVRINVDTARKLFAFCESEASWLRDTIERVVSLESPSDDKAAVDRCGAFLEQTLSGIGASVERIAQASRGDHLRARWPQGDAADGDRGSVLLLGPFGTVWPGGSLKTMPVRELEGRLHGPGIFDMKSGIVVAMLAIRALQALAIRRSH